MNTISAGDFASRREEIPADFVAANELLEENGWTDGLPVIPPTESLVETMLSYSSAAPSDVLGRMQPGNATVTAEKVAANAVMAGCRPEYFPVVLAAVRAILRPQFHVGSTSCTTGGAAPVVIVSGPIAAKLKINSADSCFAGSFRANATIGRALRLTMRNLGGAKPGGQDKSTQAWPGKMTFCFAENEARNPWEPLRVTQGFPANVSTVTVLAVRGVYPVCEGTQDTGLGVLQTLAASMRVVGSPIYNQTGWNDTPVLLVLGPEHAAEIAKAGFSKAHAQLYLHEHARMPVRDLINRVYYGTERWPPWIDVNDPNATVPIVVRATDFMIVIAGGDGRHSAWMPAWHECQGATEMIEDAPASARKVG
jgi:hypothetical protein